MRDENCRDEKSLENGLDFYENERWKHRANCEKRGNESEEVVAEYMYAVIKGNSRVLFHKHTTLRILLQLLYASYKF